MTRRAITSSAAHGFTLIEVMAVVALIGLLAAATAWSLADDAQRARHDDVIDRLTHTDELARAAARRMGPRTLHFDLERQRVWVQGPADSSGRPRSTHALTMPSGFRIEQVLWLDPDMGSVNQKGQRETIVESAGEVQVPISPEGISHTYAIKLNGPEPAGQRLSKNEQTKQDTWLLFSGLTGQITSDLDEYEIETLMSMLANARPDAD